MSPRCAVLGSLLNEYYLVLLRSILSDSFCAVVIKEWDVRRGLAVLSCIDFWPVVCGYCFNMAENTNNKENENHSLDLYWQATIGLVGSVSSS